MENIEVFDLKSLRTNDVYMSALVEKIKTVLKHRYKIEIETTRQVFRDKKWFVYEFYAIKQGIVSKERKLFFRLNVEMKETGRPEKGADFALETTAEKSILGGIERLISEEVG